MSDEEDIVQYAARLAMEFDPNFTPEMAKAYMRRFRLDWHGEPLRPVSLMSPEEKSDKKKRLKIAINEVTLLGASPSEAAARHGIPRRTLYRWFRRIKSAT